MADREQPYDPYIPSGHTAPPGGAHQGGDGRTAALQAKINETVGIMKQNVLNTSERGERIETIRDQATELERGSSAFRTSARKVKRKMCVSNMKWGIAVAVVVILIIIIVAVSVKKAHP